MPLRQTHSTERARKVEAVIVCPEAGDYGCDCRGPQAYVWNLAACDRGGIVAYVWLPAQKKRKELQTL